MTLATSALKCAIQLGRANAAGTAINDLETQIKEEIGEAIRSYNRQPWHLTEFRGFTLTTAATSNWYSTVDLTTGDGDQDDTSRTAINVNDILNIQYARENPGSSGLNEPLYFLGYKQFESQLEGSTPNGPPTYFTRYAGQIGIWPTPDAAYTLYFSGNVKPVIPISDTDTSIWLDECEEMVVAGACKRVCIKHLRDRDRTLDFTAVEKEAMTALETEHLIKTSTGRLRSHD